MELTWQFMAWAAFIWIATFLLSLLVVTILLVNLPRTYFLDRTERGLWVDRHPILRGLLHVMKNLLGLCLVAMGLFLSLPGIPGQGLLTILLGVMLMDFPGKLAWERRLVGRPRILAAINRLRGAFGKPPLLLPASSASQRPERSEPRQADE